MVESYYTLADLTQYATSPIFYRIHTLFPTTNHLHGLYQNLADGHIRTMNDCHTNQINFDKVIHLGSYHVQKTLEL